MYIFQQKLHQNFYREKKCIIFSLSKKLIRLNRTEPLFNFLMHFISRSPSQKLFRCGTSTPFRGENLNLLPIVCENIKIINLIIF